MSHQDIVIRLALLLAWPAWLDAFILQISISDGQLTRN